MTFYEARHADYLLKIFCAGLNQHRVEDGRGFGATSQLQQSSHAVLQRMRDVFILDPSVVSAKYQERIENSALLNGVYWIVASLILLERCSTTTAPRIRKVILDAAEPLKALVAACFCSSSGGYSAAPNLKPCDNIMATMSAVQLLSLLDRSDSIPRESILRYVVNLYDPVSGGFFFSIFAKETGRECDLRQTLCALVILHHLNPIALLKGERSAIEQTAQIDYENVVQWILAGQNLDGGFGNAPGNESHAGYTYCAVASLELLGSLDTLLKDFQRLNALQRFLKARTLFIPPLRLDDTEAPRFVNGRPGKPADVCYSWWVLATQMIIWKHQSSQTQTECLTAFDQPSQLMSYMRGILMFQSPEGGFARALPEPLNNVTRPDRGPHRMAEESTNALLPDVVPITSPINPEAAISNSLRHDSESTLPSSASAFCGSPVLEDDQLSPSSFPSVERAALYEAFFPGSSHRSFTTPDPYHTFFSLATLFLLMPYSSHNLLHVSEKESTVRSAAAPELLKSQHPPLLQPIRRARTHPPHPSDSRETNTALPQNSYIDPCTAFPIDGGISSWTS